MRPVPVALKHHFEQHQAPLVVQAVRSSRRSCAAPETFPGWKSTSTGTPRSMPPNGPGSPGRRGPPFSGFLDDPSGA